jgi:hypothetical protein
VVVIAVQPFDPTSHARRLVADAQADVPCVQLFVQQEAAPAAPLQAPLVHVDDDVS